MACLKFVSQVEYQSLTAATALTLIEVIAPTNQRVKVLGWGVSFNGTNVSILATPADTSTRAPVEAVLGVGTAAGTFTDTLGALDAQGSVTVVGDIDGTVQSVSKTTSTAEPTYTGVYDVMTVNPTGNYTVEFKEPLVINGGDFIGIELTAPYAVSARVKLICEE